MKSSLRVLALLLVFAVTGRTESLLTAVDVRVDSRPSGEQTLCSYTVTNHTPQEIVAFAIGGNENLAGPYELSLPPAGFDGDTGAGVNAPSPDGWEVSRLSEPAAPLYAVEWQTKDVERSIRAMKSETFYLPFDQEPPSCAMGHWTAITRDSQVHSGFLKVSDR